jgi:hypothetical protein
MSLKTLSFAVISAVLISPLAAPAMNTPSTPAPVLRFHPSTPAPVLRLHPSTPAPILRSDIGFVSQHGRVPSFCVIVVSLVLRQLLNVSTLLKM